MGVKLHMCQPLHNLFSHQLLHSMHICRYPQLLRGLRTAKSLMSNNRVRFRSFNVGLLRAGYGGPEWSCICNSWIAQAQPKVYLSCMFWKDANTRGLQLVHQWPQWEHSLENKVKGALPAQLNGLGPVAVLENLQSSHGISMRTCF